MKKLIITQIIKEIKLKLLELNNITNIKEMFRGCKYLLSLSEMVKDNDQQENTTAINILPEPDDKQIYQPYLMKQKRLTKVKIIFVICCLIINQKRNF